MWAIVIAYMGQHWGYWTLMTEIPTYMNAILDYDIEEVNIFFSLKMHSRIASLNIRILFNSSIRMVYYQRRPI